MDQPKAPDPKTPAGGTPVAPSAVTPVGIDETLPAGAALTPRTPGSGGSGGRRGEGPPAFQSGDLVAERYRIVKPLGEGGMGEVYEAEDLLLKERVALKTLRDTVADDETTILRFKREIQLSRKVTHPNVCRIFDVGLDRRGGRESAFLTMELVAGETLAARLRRVGRLAIPEALPIAEQIGAALAAAHGAGVVHRDLKCANVLLVGGGPEVRAVVTDFGLARAAAADGGDTVTGDGGIVGSPAYMAPEQIEGGRRLTGSVDVYAFGVVLFEMVTGRLPFVGENPLATAVKRLREAPPSPRSFVPELDEKWEQAILWCLGRTPEERPATATEVLRALRGELAAPVATPPPPAPLGASQPVAGLPRRGRRRKIAVVVAGLIAVGVVVEALNSDRHRRDVAVERREPIDPAIPVPPVAPPPPVAGVRPPLPPPAAPGSHARRAVAILGFRNNSARKETDYVSTAISEMLSSELMAGDELRTVPGESVARAKQQLGLETADSYAADTLRKLRRLLDTDFVVSGSYLVQGNGQLRLDVKLQDARSGEIAASVAETGDVDDLSSLAETVGERLRDGMHVEAATEGEKQDVRALMPKDTDVTRLYAEGLALMRVQNCAAARGPLEQAVGSDPSFALAHRALAEVLECLGYEKRALDEAERAVALSKDLPPETRLQAEAYYHKLTGHPEKAVTAYEELFKRAPDNYDFGIKLLQLQKGIAPDDARKTLAALRALGSPASESAELDMTEAMLSGNDDAKLVALERAKARAEAHGARLVAASAALNISSIMRKRGDLDRALESARRAKEIFEASGDRDGVIKALEAEALVHQKRRDQAGVQMALRAAQELGKHLDSVRSLASLEENLADVLIAQGDLNGAESALGDVMRLSDRGHKAEAQVGARMDVALVQLYRGRLNAAAREIDRAAAIAEESGSDDLKGMALFGKAFLTMVGGDLKTAHRQLDDAVELSARLVATGLPEYLEARLAMLEDEAEEAEAHARAAMKAQGERPAGDHFGRESVLMDALLAQNKVGEAKAVLEGLRARIRGDKDAFTEKLIVDIYDARIRAASPRRADKIAAINALAAVSKRAAEADFVMHRLLADVASGRVQLDIDRPRAEALLVATQKLARKRGFEFVVDEIDELLKDG